MRAGVLTTRVQNGQELGGARQTSVAEQCRAGVNAASSATVALVSDGPLDAAQSTACRTPTQTRLL